MTTSNPFSYFLTFLFLICFWFSIPISYAQKTKKLKAHDYTEILQLYFTYPIVLDSGDGEAFADLFTEDGAFGDKVIGRQALIEFATREPRNIRHAPLTPLIVPTETGAKGIVVNLFVDVSESPAQITRISQYTDTLVKTSMGWKFKSRVNGTADLRDPKSTLYQEIN